MSDSDIDALLDDEEESDNENKRDNAAFAKMRKELKEAQKRAEAAEASAAEFAAKERTTVLTETFGSMGLNPKHAKFYPTEAEPTADAVKQWAVTEGFIQVEEGEQVERPKQEEAGFTPTVIQDARMIGTKVYDVQEFEQLARMDPKRAAEVYKAGRVKKEDPWTVGQPMSFVHDSLDK